MKLKWGRNKERKKEDAKCPQPDVANVVNQDENRSAVDVDAREPQFASALNEFSGECKCRLSVCVCAKWLLLLWYREVNVDVNMNGG